MNSVGSADRPRRRRRRTIGLVLLGVGVVLLAGLVWSVVALLSLRTHASAAADDVREVQAAVEARDTGAALAAARAAAVETSQASAAASAWPLRVLSHLPVAGSLLTDVRTLATATDRAVGDGAVPLLRVVNDLGGAVDGGDTGDAGGLVRDGAVDLARLQDAAASVSRAADSLREARTQVETLDPATFPQQVRDQVSSARDGIGELSTRADDADSALAVLPAALGADGPRSYLVVFQNTAEARPTGGIVGTWAQVSVDAGRASLTGTGSNDDLLVVSGSAEGLSPELQALYGDGAVLLQNANLSPDFAVAGQIITQIWQGLGRPAPDGVIGVDPQGMAPLLRGKGDIGVPGGPAINADTVVDVLLRQVYVDFSDDNDARKEYLSTVVGTVFADVLGGGAFNADVLGGLVDAGQDGHIVAWSPRENEQAALVRGGLSGALPTPSPGSVGLYLTNVDASKLDYYLSAAVTAAPTCAPVGEPVAEDLSIVLTNDAPEKVPTYVSNKLPDRPDTTLTTQVGLYLPPGRGVEQVSVDGTPVGFSSGTESQWSWLRLQVDVPRGSSVTVAARLSGQTPTTSVETQPLVNPLKTDLGECP